MFRALSYRPFALLWAGQAVSRLGDGIHAVALAWWVLEATGSAAAMGTVLACGAVPEVLFLLVGGVGVDRLPRAWPLLASDLLRGGLMLLAALLAWQDALALWHLFVLAALFGFARALFAPAITAAVPDLLPAEALPSANAVRSLSRQLGGIVGPVLGGLLVAQGGTDVAFALDGLSFLVAAGCVAAVSGQPALRRAVPASVGVLRDLREGFSTVLAVPWLWISIAVAGVTGVLLTGPVAAVLPLLIEEEFGGSVQTLALLNALLAGGAAVVP